MWVTTSVERCAVCDELTPHSRRWVAVPKLLSLALLAGATVCFTGETWVWFAGWILLGLALYVYTRDRERCWRIHCERCRGRELRLLGKTKPTLDGNTEINVL